MEKLQKRYRPNVAAVIVSPSYPERIEIFIGSRSDIAGAWQFPQGGIDAGEKPQEALLRELSEEIGTSNVEILAEFPEWIRYDFPDTIAPKMYPYDGQEQKYFLVRLKNRSSINICTKEPEFDSFKFVGAKDVLKHISSFKKPIYQKVLNWFSKNGYL